MIRTALALAYVGGVAVLSAQSPAVVQTEPLAFEVASIKPNTSGANSSSVDTQAARRGAIRSKARTSTFID